MPKLACFSQEPQWTYDADLETDPKVSLHDAQEAPLLVQTFTGHKDGGMGSVVLHLCGHRLRLTYEQARELYDALKPVVTYESERGQSFRRSAEGERLWQEMVRTNEAHPYSRAIIDFAERWALEMESLLGRVIGAKVLDIAEQAEKSMMRDEALAGISGAQYGMAVKILVECWEHGEDLRRWHNLRTQVRDEGERANHEGGVLNPAVFEVQS